MIYLYQIKMYFTSINFRKMIRGIIHQETNVLKPQRLIKRTSIEHIWCKTKININPALFSDSQKLYKHHACCKSFLINTKTGCS